MNTLDENKQDGAGEGVEAPEFKDVNRVALKLPGFWEKEVELWFLNIEAQFILSDIKQDSTKYYAVVATLNSEVLSYVSDIVKNPPKSDLYKALKERLISEFSDSEQQRIKSLLSMQVLGDDKPSHLLRKMKLLADKKVGDDFLKTLWVQRLPKETQTILTVLEGDLEQMAKMADKLMEISPVIGMVSGAQVESTTISDGDRLKKLERQVELLSEQISRLGRSRTRNVQRSFSRDRYRSRERRQNVCWYHNRWGEKATSCIAPCKYSNQEN